MNPRTHPKAPRRWLLRTKAHPRTSGPAHWQALPWRLQQRQSPTPSPHGQRADLSFSQNVSTPLFQLKHMKTNFFLSVLLATLFGSASAQVAQIASTQTDAVTPFRYSGVVPIQENTQSPDGAKLPDDLLRVVHPTEGGKDVALLVFGALMGSFRLPASKEDYKGERVTSLLHPAGQPLMLGLMPIIENWVASNGADRKFKNAIFIRKDRFQLVYRDSTQEPAVYDLKIEATLSRKPDSSGFFSAPHAFTCTQTSDVSAATTLLEWQANDYEKIKVAQRLFVDDCLQLASNHLNQILAR